VADVTGRTVHVPHETELVASGAAVQAAGIVLDAPFDAIAQEWGLGRGVVVEPDERVDGKAIQAAYVEAMTPA
jgi:xylulokinase